MLSSGFPSIGAAFKDIAKSASPVSIVGVSASPNAYGDNGGNVQLTGATHGITSGVAVGKHVYVSWAGGSGVSGLQKVLSVDTTSAFTIDMDYESGLGTPTVTLANVEVVLAVIPLPALREDSQVNIRATYGCTSSTNARTVYARLNNTQIAFTITSAANATIRFMNSMCNRGAKNSQVTETSSAIPTSTAAVTLTTIDTSVSTTLTLTAKPGVANEYIELESYAITALM